MSYTELINIAEKIAESAFKDKLDKGGKPYIEHLRRVAFRASEALPRRSDELKVIGVLHDLLEDCPEWNEKSLRHIFPNFIVRAIVVLTKRKNETYEEYIGRVNEDFWAKLIKLADLEDNMDILRLSELKEEDFKRLVKYHKAYNQLKLAE